MGAKVIERRVATSGYSPPPPCARSEFEKYKKRAMGCGLLTLEGVPRTMTSDRERPAVHLATAP